MHDPVIESSGETSSAKCQLHAVLVRVFETGVLITGESGTGKSECALELVTKGHRLCADDAVEIVAANDSLVGKAPALTRNLLEVRGLGIINVPEIFGEQAVCDESRIDLCIELSDAVEDAPLENASLDWLVAGVVIPKYVLPISPGGNMATLVETAVRLHRSPGSNTTAELLVAEHARLVHPLQ
jgi:HPr kinase/phosphorylase